jgi:hypothetical protein
MSMSDVVAALSATRTAPTPPSVPSAGTSTAAEQPTHQPAPHLSVPQQSPPTAAPAPVVPGTAAALPVAEAALRQALAAGANQDPHAFALDLLRSVEALLRATAPAGVSPDDIGAAAARLVERQGLLARLADAQPSGTWPTGASPEDLDRAPTALDTRL